ncbi:hypothetical protein A0O34_01205 [Chryseobacterium glaciei]|uniref:Uncharacterized protein n=1 Tax=Chryseobacterium glaciei TaxID=1685010 RepID=A0A172XQI9_9FLAO|nr:hypothetical protein [Chryseobacterium glaciei]ANF49258.1 hypothetical protein A0O34_01205 [Chryseobacterium glaciei]
MKKQFLILIILAFCFLNCNPLYKQYKDLALINRQKKFSYATKGIIRKILAKHDNKNSLFIISWKNNVFDKEKLVFDAIIYDYNLKTIEYIYNTQSTQNKIISSTHKPSAYFDDELFILNNYIAEKEEYLLSLHDSFSSSDAGSYFYIYDFSKNKKLKISAIAFDKNGKLIQ